MSIKRYIRKPQPVKAIQVNDNWEELMEFFGDSIIYDENDGSYMSNYSLFTPYEKDGVKKYNIRIFDNFLDLPNSSVGGVRDGYWIVRTKIGGMFEIHDDKSFKNLYDEVTVDTHPKTKMELLDDLQATIRKRLNENRK